RLAGLTSDDDEDAELRLRAWVETVAPELLPWLALIAIPFDVDIALTPEIEQIAPQFRRARAHQAVADLVARAVRTPTMLLVEDLHWVDDASRDLVGELTARVTSCPWLIVLTRRPGAPPLALDPDVAARIELEPLDADAALDLVRAA